MTNCFARGWPCFATIQQEISNTGAEDVTPISLQNIAIGNDCQ